MTDQELERRLADAVARTAPNHVEGVLSRCETRKGTVIPMTKTTKKSGRAVRNLIAACLALALVGGGGGVYYQQVHAVASVVSLDVNPSIEVKVNQKEKVLSCTALNEEAAEILADMGGGADLRGTKLDVAVNAIVGALVRHGYLDSISSAILISVEDKDQNRAARLQQELASTVDSVLQANASNASVLSQTLTTDADLERQAKDSSISTGKAYLIRQVMERSGTPAADSADALDRLSALSVEELRDLLETGEKRIPIGKSGAAHAAENYAGTLAVESVTTEVDPELDENPAHYEVTLRWGAGEWEYKVDAFTGEVLSGQRDLLSYLTPSAPSSQLIGEEKAGQAALTHAGLKKSDTKYCNVQLDWDDGQPEHYEVEFLAGGTRYEYEIDPYNGTVIKVEREAYSSGSGSEAPAPPDDGDIGEAAAKSAALDHAGVKESKTTNLTVKRDWDDGRLEYEIEFWVDRTEYDYTVDGTSGAVLDYEAETHETAGSGSQSGDIGSEKAKKAALDHAGVKESDAAELKVERDYDDGRLEYEVEFKSGGMEYEYTIDGATGAVLEHERDWD